MAFKCAPKENCLLDYVTPDLSLYEEINQTHLREFLTLYENDIGNYKFNTGKYMQNPQEFFLNDIGKFVLLYSKLYLNDIGKFILLDARNYVKTFAFASILINITKLFIDINAPENKQFIKCTEATDKATFSSTYTPAPFNIIFSYKDNKYICDFDYFSTHKTRYFSLIKFHKL